MNMHPMLNIAVRAARNAGDIIVRHSSRIDELTIASKERNDYVSEVDRQAEDEIIAVIRKAYPDHGILAEESGEHGSGDKYQWIIDPLDGTTNFLHGFPQFAVSIALQHKGRLEQAVVYDPMRQELFTATRGSGAFLDNRRCLKTRIIYGDQAMFIKRTLFERLNGFPEVEIMEDILICEELVKQTTPVILDLFVTTDPRKFIKMGIWLSLYRVAAIQARHELKLPVASNHPFFTEVR